MPGASNDVQVGAKLALVYRVVSVFCELMESTEELCRTILQSRSPCPSIPDTTAFAGSILRQDTVYWSRFGLHFCAEDCM